MPTPTQVTISYDVGQQAPITQAQLISALAAITLPFENLADIGVNPVPLSDITAGSFIGATRTIVLSLFAPFYDFRTASGSFENMALVSSDANDTFGGSGAQIVRIDGLFTPGINITNPSSAIETIAFTQSVQMNGTTPVNVQPIFHDPIIGDAFSAFVGNQTPIPRYLGNPTLSVVLGTAAGQVGLYAAPNATATPDDVLLSTLLVGGLEKEFAGSIVSTSPLDTSSAPGQGLQVATISYIDHLSVSHTEVVALDGTTPVNLVNANKFRITGIANTSPGDIGGNVGEIIVFSGPNGTGGPEGLLPPSFFARFPSNEPSSSIAQLGPFVDLYKFIIGSTLISAVNAGVPVLA